MNVKFLSPFVEAAFTVLEAEVGLKTAQRGELSLERSACTTNDITALISIVGQVQGVALYGMSQTTAINIVSQILDQPFQEFDELAQSGIGELANVITGHAGKRLSEAGYEAKISPPTLVLGKGVLISTLDFDRLQVPLLTDMGEIQIHLALRELGNGGQQTVENTDELRVGR
jgi:chemotaxis protein CheX